MGWKWFKFLRATTAGGPDASSLGEGAPYYDTTLKTLFISDGARWQDLIQTGVMITFAAGTAPQGWLSCDGAAISRTTYAALHTVIGTTWGVGDGFTTFNLPDMRETVPVGIGTTGNTVAAHDTFTIGQFKDDQGQGHRHVTSVHIYAFQSTGTDTVAGNTALGGQSDIAGNDAGVPKTDGSNGTPRTGTVTRAKAAGVLWCIKY